LIDDTLANPVGPTRSVFPALHPYTSLIPYLFTSPCLPSPYLLPSSVSATPLFALLRKLRGVVPTIPILERFCTSEDEGRSSLAAITQFFFFNPWHSLHATETQLVCFQMFPHSLPKPPGWGGVTSLPLAQLAFSTPSDKIASLPILCHAKWTGAIEDAL